MRLIEAEVALSFNVKVLPLRKFLTLEKGAALTGIPIDELHDFIVKSKRVHAVVCDRGFLIHPDAFLKYVASRVKREILKSADPELKTLLLQKT